MHITKDTLLTQRALMFADGDDNYFMQQYEIKIDGDFSGVTMTVSGNLGQNNTTRVFNTRHESFNDLASALLDAGHTIEPGLL
jgi:hypothetical protein